MPLPIRPSSVDVDPTTWRPIGKPIEGHEDRVNAVAVFDDGRKAISASDDETLRLWDLGNGKQLAAITLDDRLLSVAFIPSSGLILTAGYDGLIHVLRPHI